MTFLRSLVFLIAQILVTPPYAIVALTTFPLPRLARYRVISGWSRTMIWLAKKRARYPLPRDRHGKPAADSRRDPVKASIGLGNLGLPAHFSTAGAGIEARAPVDPVLRLGTGAHEPDRHRPQPWRPGAESDGRARPRAARSR